MTTWWRRILRRSSIITCNVLAVCLIAVGIGNLALPHVQAAAARWWGEHQLTLNLGTTTSVVPIASGSMHLTQPVRLEVPRLGIRLPLLAGAYNFVTGAWRLDATHAFYVLPQSITNTLPATPLFYGHDIPAIFQPLDGVAPGEQLELALADGRTLHFRYVSDQIVEPTDDSVLRSTKPNIIFVMTCDGAFSQHRRVLEFAYQGDN